MADLTDLKNKLVRVRDNLPKLLVEASQEFTLNVKASAERNIRDKGVGKYSENKYSPGTFLGQELNSQGRTFLEDLIAKGKKDKDGNIEIEEENYISYAEFRQAQGLQAAYVDLSYSNEMWRGMLPAPTIVRGDQYITTLQHNNSEGQSKMNANFNRYGDFIYNNADMKEIKEAQSKMFFIKIKRILNE